MAQEKDNRTPQKYKIRMDYFRQPHPFRTLRKRLAIACAVLACGWALYAAFANDLSIYSPGPVAGVHSSTEAKCVLCHTGQPDSTFRRNVTDRACEKCHAGPVHHANQVFEGKAGSQPACSFCHVEHGGRTAELASVQDGFCTECHKALQVNPVNANRFAEHVTRFDGGHPEFRPIADKAVDKTPLKLNHAKHLRKDLPKPGGQRVQMACIDCHRADDRGKMIAIEFERDCQSCHSLAFDAMIPVEAPHEAAEYVEAFLRTAYSKYAGSHPGEWKTDPNWHPARNIASLRRMLDEAPRDLPQWLEARFAESKKVLIERKCRECHNEALTPPNVPNVWFAHSAFSHKPHQVLSCVSCHTGATTSTQTADILLPGLNGCVSCHNKSDSRLERCTTCHTYHPRKQTSSN